MNVMILNKTNRHVSRIIHNINIGITSRCIHPDHSYSYSTLVRNQDINALYNKPLSEWSINDVTAWLSSIENGRYSAHTPTFQQQKIDGISLQYLTENDLNLLGVDIMGDRKHIIHSLNLLSQKYNTSLPAIPSAQSTNASIMPHEQNEHQITVNLGLDSDHINGGTEISTKEEIETLPTLPSPIDDELSTSQQIEYEMPWSTEQIHHKFNARISELLLTSPNVASDTSTFQYEYDENKERFKLQGSFMELSSLIKRLYELNQSPTLDIIPRVSHFLAQCGELERIAQDYNIVPFIKPDGKLGIYSSTNAIYNADKAIIAIKKAIKSLDMSPLYGTTRTSIIGVLLNMNEINKSLNSKLAQYGLVQFWHRGSSIFDENKQLTNLQKTQTNHLLLMKPFIPSNLQNMHQIMKDFQLQVQNFYVVNIFSEISHPMNVTFISS